MRFLSASTYYSRWFLLTVFAASYAFGVEPDRNSAAPGAVAAKDEEVEEDQPEDAVSIAVARDRAKLLHKVYLATLDVMHDRYFHSNRSVVPARAMEDVFGELAEQTKIEGRWISVNTRAMSLPHEPRTDFEKTAAREIAAGKPAHERIESGMLLRATAVPLGDGCISCHTGFFKDPPKSPRFAGLILRIPVQERRE